MAFSDKYLATVSWDHTVNLIDIQSKAIYYKFNNIHKSNNNNNNTPELKMWITLFINIVNYFNIFTLLTCYLALKILEITLTKMIFLVFITFIKSK